MAITEIKIKYADFPNWRNLVEKRYRERRTRFGYVTALHLDKCAAPHYVSVSGRTVCIADDGYIWLQFFLTAKQYSLTAMFDKVGNLVLWYFDVCRPFRLSVDRIPCYEDLFVDLAVLPDMTTEILDLDELAEATDVGILSAKEAEKAVAIVRDLEKKAGRADFPLYRLAVSYALQFRRNE